MQNDPKALRTAPPDSQPDVKISLEELLEELDRESAPLPQLEAGDLTRDIYAKRHEISRKSAGNKLDEFVRLGKLKKIYKRALNGYRVAVYLPVKNP